MTRVFAPAVLWAAYHFYGALIALLWWMTVSNEKVWDDFTGRAYPATWSGALELLREMRAKCEREGEDERE